MELNYQPAHLVLSETAISFFFPLSVFLSLQPTNQAPTIQRLFSSQSVQPGLVIYWYTVCIALVRMLLQLDCTTEIYRSCVNTGHLPFIWCIWKRKKKLLLVSSLWLKNSLNLQVLRSTSIRPITFSLGKPFFFRTICFKKFFISSITGFTFISVKLQQIEWQPGKSGEIQFI